MNRFLPRHSFCCTLALAGFSCASVEAASPVNPHAHAASWQVLDTFAQTQAAGRVLSGQQSKTLWGERVGEDFRRVHELTTPQVYPAIFGFDLGNNSKLLSESGIPIATARRDTIAEAIAWWNRGALVTISWHQTSPKDAAFDIGGYASSQARSGLSDAEFHELVTPGTTLHARWQEHVDLIAPYLQQLRDAGVVVLWRPYHEMNGDWFWWCARPGADFQKLWRNLYERLVVHHGLNNLLWVWSPSMANAQAQPYYPGADLVDISGVDLYDSDPASPLYIRYPETLARAAPGKPYALTECGLFPTAEAMRSSRYLWFLCWHSIHLDREWNSPGYPAKPDQKEGNTAATVRAFYRLPFVVSLDELVRPITIEAELSAALATSGTAIVQESAGATNGRVLEWKPRGSNDSLSFFIPVPRAGAYRISAKLSGDPGSSDLRLERDEGKRAGKIIRTPGDPAGFITVEWGSYRLDEGSEEFRVAAEDGSTAPVLIDSWTLTPMENPVGTP